MDTVPHEALEHRLRPGDRLEFTLNPTNRLRRSRMENFRVAHARGTIIMNDPLDGKPMLQSKEEVVSDFPMTAAGNEVTCVVPPHAIIFVALAGLK
jgi:hypothetical protein